MNKFIKNFLFPRKIREIEKEIVLSSNDKNFENIENFLNEKSIINIKTPLKSKSEIFFKEANKIIRKDNDNHHEWFDDEKTIESFQSKLSEIEEENNAKHTTIIPEEEPYVFYDHSREK